MGVFSGSLHRNVIVQMPMIDIIHTQADAALADRLQHDITAAGYDEVAGRSVRLVIVSGRLLNDAQCMTAVDDVLDHGQHLVPVLAERIALPRLIDHLTAVDLSNDYAFAPVRLAIEAAMGGSDRLPLRVRTAAVRRSNARTGLIIALLALGMFAIGLYAVAIANVEAPLEEYNAIDTEVAATRDFLIAPTLDSYLRFLPGSAEEAAIYSATLQAIPTRIRPFVAATATAVAVEQQD